ncbi:MAG: hypothetical protein GWN73_01405, partial [Actinobacteria bacterium]|nr:hypothetical protein [Actinomycetota bacterium]NIS35431.1 hypothetical protein [Actinomycetota bacterium]NIU64159.1 hypothetical protein [Actinomycetota bacterium]NIW25957.1 hypothetical protein [Actinomycetota bacterium]
APPPPSEAFVFDVDLATDADNDGDLDAIDELTEHGRALREGLVSRTVVPNDDDDDSDG